MPRNPKDSGIKTKKEVLSAMQKQGLVDLNLLVKDGARDSEMFKAIASEFKEFDEQKRLVSDAELKAAYEHELGKRFPNRPIKRRGSSGGVVAPEKKELTLAEKIAERDRLEAEIGQYENIVAKHKEGKKDGAVALGDRIVAIREVMEELKITEFQDLIDIVENFGGNARTPAEIEKMDKEAAEDE